jgi:hypothetical protein
MLRKLTFVASALLAASLAASASASETASATIAAAPIAGGFQYTLSLTNTSTDGSTIGTFWFSWIPGADYMEAKPTAITFPAGWSDNITGANNASDGNAIQYLAGTPAADLAQGGTDTFTFDSTEPLSQILGPSTVKDKEVETTYFVYSGAPFSDGGFKSTATAVPEPATLALLALSGPALLLRRKRA